MAIIYGRADSEKQLLDKYPKSIKNVEDIDTTHEEIINDLKVEKKGFFAKIKRYKKKKELEIFEINKNSNFHAGSEGELKVLNELSKLSNNYHVLCGLQIGHNYFSYKGRVKVKISNIDFVVVSRKGVIQIEVKNWSNEFLKKTTKNPYKQTDRAGKTLWVYLKSWRFSPRVTNVLLPIQKNMNYNSFYKHVMISNLDRINYFIQNRKEELSDKHVKKIIKKLKDRVTK